MKGGVPEAQDQRVRPSNSFLHACFTSMKYDRLLPLPISFSGVAKAALNCASDEHILIVRVLRAWLARYVSRGWGLIDLPLRASNEGSPRPRVARAQKIIRLHPPSL